MGNARGVTRDFEELERRRMKAGKLLARGVSQAEVARRLGVHRQSVSRWSAELEQGGPESLRGAGRAGRKRRLSDSQLEQLEQMLEAGPETAGFPTNLWTCERVSEVIEREFGVQYHASHVWKILGSLGWSCQRPTGRAIERDEAAIRRWKRVDWPRIKKKPKTKGERSSSSTKVDSRNDRTASAPGPLAGKRQSSSIVSPGKPSRRSRG